MDQNLLRQYLATVYDLPTGTGPLRVSLDGDVVQDLSSLPELLIRPFTLLTFPEQKKALRLRGLPEDSQRNFMSPSSSCRESSILKEPSLF